jgi:hypothetical protein
MFDKKSRITMDLARTSGPSSTVSQAICKPAHLATHCFQFALGEMKADDRRAVSQILKNHLALGTCHDCGR